ncbi:succinate dehydrogenase, partial [Candidatus Bipolaricaulota bacterium]
RGVHYREEFPDTDNEQWLQEIVLVAEDEGTGLSTRPINTTSLDPPSGTIPYFEMVKKMMLAHSDVGGHH